MMTSQRKIRPTRRHDAPAAGSGPRRDGRPRAGARAPFPREADDFGWDEGLPPDVSRFGAQGFDDASGRRPDAPPLTVPGRPRGRPKARLLFSLAALVLAFACWVFRAELYKVAAIGGNGVVLSGLLMLPVVLAYFAFRLVRLLVKKGRKILASFFLCFALLFGGWVSVNVAASLLCDAEIDAALARLPPVRAKVFYVRSGGREAPVYLPTDRGVSVAELAASYSNSTVPAIEDERLRLRWEGVFDLRSLLRAVRDMIFFHRREGASTILVQVAKWIRIKNRQQTFTSTAKDKLMQWFLALRLSQRFPSPEEQLALYLSLVEIDGAHGFAYAANDFFGVPLEKLNLEQSALLAALLNNPTQYNPRTHPQAALERRNLVLDKMVDNSWVKDVSAQKAAPLGLARPESTAEFVFFARAAAGRKGE